MPASGFECGRELRHTHEEVKDEPGRTRGGDATLNVVPKEPGRIRFVMHLVANSDELPVEISEHTVDIGRGQVDPADDAEDERRRSGYLEQLSRFLEGCVGLNDHRACDFVLA
jgi:hypothetical protein